MKILPMHRPYIGTYVYVVVDCTTEDIDEIVSFCQTIATGDWLHTFNLGKSVNYWFDRCGSIIFRSKQDAAIFKLRYFEEFEKPTF